MNIFLFSMLAAASLHAADWPNWRGGADGSGVTSETALPLKWSATENVAWKIALPERGNSTPVVAGGRVFFTQAIEKEKLRTLVCVSAQDGSELWKKSVRFDKAEETHGTNPYCSASPATDGKRVIVCHGSAGVFCYDMQGAELWRRDFGPQEYEWGNGSSPVIHKGRCHLYFGPGKGARLLALDVESGKDLWSFTEGVAETAGRTDGFRGNEPGMVCSYATPIVVNSGARDELIMLFPGVVRAFDPGSGAELWQCGGMNPLVYCSPIFGDGVVVGMGGFFGTTIAAMAGGKGTVEPLWKSVRTKNRLGSGVVHEGHVYVFNTDGFAECIELKTGKTVYLERVKAVGPKGESWSSYTLSGDRLYVLNQSGDCIVLRAAPKFEVLATNHIGSALTNASLAVSDGRIYIRTHEHLWCVK